MQSLSNKRLFDIAFHLTGGLAFAHPPAGESARSAADVIR